EVADPRTMDARWHWLSRQHRRNLPGREVHYLSIYVPITCPPFILRTRIDLTQNRILRDGKTGETVEQDIVISGLAISRIQRPIENGADNLSSVSIAIGPDHAIKFKPVGQTFLGRNRTLE